MTSFFLVILTISIFGNIWAFFYNKNGTTKTLYILYLVTMFIIAASQTYNNDYNAYEYYYRTAGLSNLSGVEVGFISFARFSRDTLNLSYSHFRTLYLALMIGIVGFYIWRLSEKPNMVIFLYSILFLSVNIVQIRSGMAEAFVVASIYYLEKKNLLKYCICFIIGVSFHSSVFYFLLCLLLLYDKPMEWIYSHKKGIIISSLLAIVAFRVIGALIPAVVHVINMMGDDYRMSAQFAGYDGNHYLKYLPVPFFMILLFCFVDKNYCIEKKTIFYESIAYLSLYIYPFFTINRQLSRISRTSVLIALVFFTEYLFRNSRYKWAFNVFFLIFLGFTYYALSAYTSCLQPLLEYSILSQIF